MKSVEPKLDLAFSSFYDGKERPDAGLLLNEGEHVIYLAGGCFWGMEKLMEAVPGVVDAVSGYANGSTKEPSYEEVCTGKTGHRETVRVVYRRQKVSLESLLYIFLDSIDPSQTDRQGNDIGTQYQTGIYFCTDEDRGIVRKTVGNIRAGGTVVRTELLPLSCFYPAEEYHQNYLEKHPGGYCHVHPTAIRNAGKLRIDAAGFTRPDEKSIRKKLSPLQYRVTQEGATEPPFSNAYDDTYAPGIYVDVVTGEPLFSSRDKFNSGCGWPAFDRPIDENVITEHTDLSHGMVRTEVRSRVGASHLGHVFDGEGFTETDRRYCINSSALRFVPLEKMEAEGYGDLMDLV